ncbi:MAG: aminotransferase class IV [Chloroflexi bacterium]|nr:aminotransferase class IV [Chloroflexota bacterium]
MNHLQLFAVTKAGPQSLPVATDATDLADLLHGLALGVYSSMRTFAHDQFLDLEDHLARTVRSMKLLGWPYEFDERNLRQVLQQVCTNAPWPETRVRIDILAEPARHLGTDSRVLIGLMPFQPPPATLYQTGVTLGLAEGITRSQPLVKTAAFAEVRKGYTETTPHADESAVYEYVMTDAQGQILEGLSSNFYAVHQGVIHTAGTGVLEGVTRKILLTLIEQLGLPLSLAAIHVAEIPQLTEAAISSSARGLLPVVNMAGQTIGSGQPGPICTQLHKAYDTFVANTIRPAFPY